MQQVQTVNKATLHAYEGTAVEQFYHLQPSDILTSEAYAALGEMLLQFAEGAIEYHTEATDQALLSLKPSTARFRMKKLGISKSDYMT